MHEGAERPLLEAVLIHKNHARVSPRLIAGSSPRSAALLLSGSSPSCHQKKLEGNLCCDSADSNRRMDCPFRSDKPLMHTSRHREFPFSVGEHEQRLVFF
jgi:hypothetical protein